MISTIPSILVDNAIQSFGNQMGGLSQTGMDAEMLGKYSIPHGLESYFTQLTRHRQLELATDRNTRVLASPASPNGVLLFKKIRCVRFFVFYMQ
jgi:hypothetical protein